MGPSNKINLAVIALLLVAAAIMVFLPTPRSQSYDCGMAEWHPDIPTQVREACRKRYTTVDPSLQIRK